MTESHTNKHNLITLNLCLCWTGPNELSLEQERTLKYDIHQTSVCFVHVLFVLHHLPQLRNLLVQINKRNIPLNY